MSKPSVLAAPKKAKPNGVSAPRKALPVVKRSPASILSLSCQTLPTSTLAPAYTAPSINGIFV